MNDLKRFIFLVVAQALFLSSAFADIVTIRVTGSVVSNQIQTSRLINVHAGDPVTVSALVDSDEYQVHLLSPGAVRSYELLPGSFSMQLGSVVLGLRDPFPPGLSPHFILVDYPANSPIPRQDQLAFTRLTFVHPGLPTDEVGVVGDVTFYFIINFVRTYLSSFNIEDYIGRHVVDSCINFMFQVSDEPSLRVPPKHLQIQFSQMEIGFGAVRIDQSNWGSIKALYR